MIGVSVFAKEITESKRAIDKLERGEKEFHTLFQEAITGNYVSTPEGKIILCNTKFLEIFGFKSMEEAFNTPIQVLYKSKEDRDKMKKRILNEKKLENFELELIRRDGKTIHILENIVGQFNNKGILEKMLGYVIDITERQQMENELRESEVRLNEAMQIARLGTWEYDVDSEQFKFNDQFYKIMRTTAEREGGYFMPAIQYAQKFVHPDDMSVVGVETNKALETTDPNYYSHLDHRIIFADGEIGYVSVNIRIDKDSHGRTVKTYGVNQDITERKLAEEKLEESEEKFRVASESLTDIIYDWDIKEKIDWYGDIDGLMGYSPGEFPRTLEAWAVSVHPEDKDRVWAALESHLKGMAPYIIEYRIARRDGELRWWSVRGIALRNDRGESYKMIGSITDITERKQAAEALSNERSLLRTIIDLIPDAIYAVDIEGRKILANAKEIELSGKNNEDEIIGKTDFDLYPESEAQRYYEADQIIIQSGKPNLDIEDTLISKDGQIHWLLGSKVPLRNVHGQITGIVGVNHDITERKQAEEVLRQERDFSRTIIETSPTFFVAIGSDGKTIMMNDSMLKTLGYNSSEVVGIDYLTNFVPVKDREKLSKIFEALATSSKSTLNENSILTKDGRKIIVEWHGKNILKPNGELNYFFGIGIDITERKRADELLRESEERFRHSFDYAAIGICLVGTEGKFQKINNVFREMIGYEEDEIKNFTFSDITHPDDSSIGLSQLKKMLDGEIDSTSFEKRYIRKDRRIIWVYLSISLIRNVNHQPQFFITQIIDITKRKQVEKALKESEKKFRLVWEKSAEGMRITNEEGIVVLVNDAYCKLVGKPLNDIEGKLMSVVHEEARQVEILLKHEEQFHTRNIPRYLEKEIILWNGKKLFAEVLSTFLEIENHPTLLLSIFKDISERKRAEEALRDSEVRYRSLIQSANDAIITTDEKGTILSSNLGAEKIFGYTEGEITGKELGLIIPPVNVEKQIKEIELIKLGGEHPAVGKTIEMFGIHKSRKEFPLELSLSKWETSSGKYFTGIIRDISERKLVESELIAAKEKAEEINRIKSVFLANMSHELRTPLVGILGFADILFECLTDESEKTMAESILHSGKRLLNTLSSILSLSELEKLKEKIDLSPANVNPLCSDIIDFYKVNSNNTNVELKTEFQSNSLELKINSRWLRETLNHLVKNSVNYTESGFILIRTYKRVEPISRNSFGVIEVVDTGIGIPKDKQVDYI